MTSATAVRLQPRLFELPLAGLVPLPIDEANHLLIAWGHRLGACNRPFTQAAYALEVDGRPVSVAVSASLVGNHVAWEEANQPRRLARLEVVELARLCSAPTERWATRVMLRLWREVCAPRWPDWPVRAAVSYSQSGRDTGNTYRFDGWRKVREDSGSTGGGTWSRRRTAADAVAGRKSLWLWEFCTIEQQEDQS